MLLKVIVLIEGVVLKTDVSSFVLAKLKMKNFVSNN